MVGSKSLPVKQAKANENPQGFQNWNRQMDSTSESMQSSMDDPTQLKSKEFQHNPNQRLVAIQKMADDSPNNQKLIQLQSLATAYNQQRQLPFQLKKNNSGLPDSLKSGVENLSGLSMDDVKVHYNSDKPAQLNAHAYAQGTDIHLASGQEKHLPHEAWHVVQQKQGRVQPTMMMKAKVPINDDQGLEKEADVMGARALQMKPFSLSDYRTENSVQTKGVVQKAGGKSSKEKPKPKKSSEEKEWDTWKAENKIDHFEEENPITEEDKVNFGKRKEDEEDSQHISKFKGIEFDQEFIESPFWSASIGIEKIDATKIPMEQHKGIKKAYHTTTNKVAGGKIIEKIDRYPENPDGRFGGGFYVASNKQTCFAELASHERDQFDDLENKNPENLPAVEIIEFDVSGGDLVDCTAGELAIMVDKRPKEIEARVRKDRRDGIVFNSTKGSGMNIVLYQNYESILKPTTKTPQPARKDYDKFKNDKLSARIDKMEKNGDLSKGNSQTDTGDNATL